MPLAGREHETEPPPQNLTPFQGIADVKAFLDEDLLRSYGRQRVVASPQELLSLFLQPPFTTFEWAYRGHRSSNWVLTSTLERVCGRSPLTLIDFTSNKAERNLFNEFCRHAHHYISNPPSPEKILEWYALMRHHGVPTRLVDWTRSPYVAAFFAAVEDSDDDFAVWAINAGVIRTESFALFTKYNPLARSSALLSEYDDLYHEDILRLGTPAAVLPIEPYKSNQRALAQQGLFLYSNTTNWPFSTCLKYVLRHARLNDRDAGSALYKLQMPSTLRIPLLKELARMNISYATLFPGLDGFARSLETNLRLNAPYL